MELKDVYISKNEIREEKIERFYEIVIYDELKRKKYQSWFTPNVERATEIADILLEMIDEYQEVHIFLEDQYLNKNIYSLVYAR